MAPALPSLIFLSAFVAVVASHGVMMDPRQRGALNIAKYLKVKDIDVKAPRDHKAHFPAGDKSSSRAAGSKSQKKAGGRSYHPFDPYNKSFNWRAGVCGDLEDEQPQPHLKGGEYYYNGKIVQKYTAGNVVDFSTSILANHHGFFEFHICNLDSCPDDDISSRCFRKGHCQQLLRAPNRECDNKKSNDCGPIDRNYPGRWYLPCKRHNDNDKQVKVFGGAKGSMKYKIPDDLKCKHCVVMWYWASSDTCEAVGVEDYFTGPDRPKWEGCRNDMNANDKYGKGTRPDCGGREFTQEYYQCADVVVREA